MISAHSCHTCIIGNKNPKIDNKTPKTAEAFNKNKNRPACDFADLRTLTQEDTYADRSKRIDDAVNSIHWGCQCITLSLSMY